MLNNSGGPPGGRDDSGPAPPLGEPDHFASTAAKRLNTASIDGAGDTAAALRRDS